MYAIAQHTFKYFGRNPQALIMHPVVWDDLRSDREACYDVTVSCYGSKPAYMGMPVIVTPDCKFPAILCADNEVEII